MDFKNVFVGLIGDMNVCLTGEASERFGHRAAERFKFLEKYVCNSVIFALRIIFLEYSSVHIFMFTEQKSERCIWEASKRSGV